VADCGGSVADTLTVRDDVDDCRLSLVTVSTTVYMAGRVYWCVAVTPVPFDPSPKSQANVPLLELDDDALKMTSWLIAAFVGEKVSARRFARRSGNPRSRT